MSASKNKAVVIDCGSSTVRAGFAPEQSPDVAFPNIIGYEESDKSVYYFGDEVKETLGRKKLVCSSPMDKGLVTNWDDMEKVWDYVIYKQLKQDPKNLPILMTQIPFLPDEQREKITEIMFEKFQVPSFYLAIQSVLSLYSTGRKEGLVFDCGEDVTYIVPVKDGFAVKDKIQRFDYGGGELTRQLQTALRNKGVSIDDLSVVRDIKEKHCYVAANAKLELSKSTEETYTLPDGSSVKLGTERFQCPEVMFNPQKMGEDGIPKKINNIIQQFDAEFRQTLYNGIIVAGGGSLLKGLAGRLSKEMSVLTAKEIKVRDYPLANISAWIGGSLLASLDDFKSYWITRADYHENGAKIVHSKCA